MHPLYTLCTEGTKRHLEGAPLEYCEREYEGVYYLGFDVREQTPPTPFVMAMVGLREITSMNRRLLMLIDKEPKGLLERVGSFFEITIEQDGPLYLIEFGYVPNLSSKADLVSNVDCKG